MKNTRQQFDKEITAICNYVCDYQIDSDEAYQTAYYDLLDSLACGLQALKFPACTKLLGPVVAGANLENGALVPGTDYQLDPVQAAFNIGAIIRWLDFNDTWLAAEWGHPSDNLGGILAVADYLSRNSELLGAQKFTVHDILTAMIKAHEIQGVLALENSFNRVGLDHVILVKVATTAVVAQMLGCDREQICNAISLAWVDGQSLRTYRHAPNTGSRKSWAAGDATSRGVRLALMAKRGEMGYPSALTAPTWGFYDVSFKGNSFQFQRDYGSYVMENILFKISYPAEFHAQTAAECAIKLHTDIKNRMHDIEKIVITTQESAMRIINKVGPLHNPADRDHSLQYITAIGLIYGELNTSHYEDDIASNGLIDQLRDLMDVSEEPRFTAEYLDPDKRSIGNSVQVFFKDGSSTEKVSIDYPIGHRRRRDEGIPVLMAKFKDSVGKHYSTEQAQQVISLCSDRDALLQLPVTELTSALACNVAINNSTITA